MNITDQILDQIEQISATKKYWLVRTQGGEYFDAFKMHNFIAVGPDKILLSDIDEAQKAPNPKRILGEKISRKFPAISKPGHAASQMLKFVYEIKNGDIVLIPTANSYSISFGEVQETKVYLKEDSSDFDNCPFEIRKRVEWLKTVDKYKLNPHLFRLLNSHHALTEASGYDQYIDKTINSFFVKNGRSHLVIDVSTPDGINAMDLFELGINLLKLVDEFCEEYLPDCSSNDIETKINLESPGTIEFITEHITALTAMGIFIVFLIGGDMEVSAKVLPSFKLKTPGLLGSISKFLTEKADRKRTAAITSQLQKMQIQSPEDVKKLISDGGEQENELKDDKSDTTN